MLDQNTDRMWYIIGAVLLGAGLLFMMNDSFPQLFAGVTNGFSEMVGTEKSADEDAQPIYWETDGKAPPMRPMRSFQDMDDYLKNGFGEYENIWTMTHYTGSKRSEGLFYKPERTMYHGSSDYWYNPLYSTRPSAKYSLGQHRGDEWWHYHSDDMTKFTQVPDVESSMGTEQVTVTLIDPETKRSDGFIMVEKVGTTPYDKMKADFGEWVELDIYPERRYVEIAGEKYYELHMSGIEHEKYNIYIEAVLTDAVAKLDELWRENHPEWYE